MYIREITTEICINMSALGQLNKVYINRKNSEGGFAKISTIVHMQFVSYSPGSQVLERN